MIVILTALQVEHQAVLDHLIDVDVHKHSEGTLFDVGCIATCPERRVALGITGAGALGAAALTERALTEFSPAAIIFAGIAGGLRGWLEIGDVIVATKIHAYHGGRSEDTEFLARPNAWLISHELEQIARRIPRSNKWRASLPGGDGDLVPGVHFEAIAAGDVVLNSATSPEAERIRRNFNDAVAVEMESSGFAHAGHLHRRVPMATIRAISDRADGTKSSTDRQGGQRVAATNAAAFAIALAAAVDDEDTTAKPGLTPPAAPPTFQSTNDASNSTVSAQVGFNWGDLRVAQPE